MLERSIDSMMKVLITLKVIDGKLIKSHYNLHVHNNIIKF